MATLSAPTASASSGLTDGTYTGDAVAIKWGDVQVQAVIEGGKITSVEFLTYPTDRESQQINSQAAPTLIQEAIETQSATVQVVSGATFTSLAFGDPSSPLSARRRDERVAHTHGHAGDHRDRRRR